VNLNANNNLGNSNANYGGDLNPTNVEMSDKNDILIFNHYYCPKRAGAKSSLVPCGTEIYPIGAA
jgi:hypothetical protein